MLVLAVTAFGRNQIPTIILDQPYDITYLHGGVFPLSPLNSLAVGDLLCYEEEEKNEYRIYNDGSIPIHVLSLMLG